MDFFPYGKQKIDQADITAVVKTLKSDFLTQGPEIRKFEDSLRKVTGAKYAVVVNSGTAALHAAYYSIGLAEDDEFITTPLTFAATSNAGLYLGAKPVFVDIDPSTGIIDPDLIEAKITNKTKLICPIHYAGHPVDQTRIKKIARKYNLRIVSDACHALGAKYQDNPIGSGKYSDVSVFSFHPVKHVTTGEGGALLTNDKQVYQRALQFRTHGITKCRPGFKKKNQGEWYYEMQFLGFNYRMSDILASLGRSQLTKLDKFVKKRRLLAKRYNQLFQNNLFFDLPLEESWAKSSYHLYVIRLRDKCKAKKTKIFNKLKKSKLGVQVHYIPVYYHPYYQKLGYKRGLCPNAEDFYQRAISIPMYYSLTYKQQKEVTKRILNTFRRCV